MKSVLIIGNHPLRRYLMEQWQAKDWQIDAYASFKDAGTPCIFHQLCVLPDDGISDEDTINSLEAFIKVMPPTDPSTPKPICHLLLHSRVSLWLLQTLDFCQELNEKLELYPFTMEDQWAKNVICQPNSPHAIYPHLDRERIDRQSNRIVHLVIQGLSEMGESLALHAALTAHYPNYIRDHALRTRITIFDEDMTKRKNAFMQRYRQLFDHSYHRSIDLASQSMTQFHEPLYKSSREDFVDVEWEFVEGNLYHPIAQQKVASWACDEHQMLTLALCDAQCQNNFNQAFAFPSAVFQNDIPVLVYVRQATLLEKVRKAGSYGNLYPFGMEDCGYDVNLPLLQMAKRLNYCYACSFGKKGIPTHLPVDEVDKEWSKLPTFRSRYSNIHNVMTLATKMRSLGHPDDDWSQFYALSKEEIELESIVEHNRWCVDILLQGFRPPTDKERKAIQENIHDFITASHNGTAPPEKDLKAEYKRKKVHYDLCAFNELREDKTGQNVKVYDYDLTVSIPLIAQSYNESLP
ncbi:MAG: hypothetical protein IKU00_02535 [Bacteroidales bacterium]|nr:hypothetical protein [Bacteroidales bacterium]